jgi:radical SAM superfamily enzyme YgiQ (UPF0313 family)
MRGALCLGITVLTGAPIHDALAVSRAVKAAHPRCTIVWGGWHPSLFAAECVEEASVDIVVSGQGEETFADVLDRLASGAPVAGCAGTTVLWDGVPLTGPSRTLRELDRFPRHDYTLLPVERYFALKGKRQLDYISSQGCRFRCAFCADPAVYGRAWTGLGPERVAAEIVEWTARYALQEVAFQDETFFTHAARVQMLCDELLRRGSAVSWTATLRADQACRLGEAAWHACVEAGLRRVMVGVESGSQATLDRLKKDLRVEQVVETAERCRRHGVGAIFNFIVGFPGEPDESVRERLVLAWRLRCMDASFETPIFYYRAYPGNPLADEARASGYTFPRGLEAWADFVYVGARGPWVSPARWRHVERFKFYSRHASRPGRWRWPLRAASRWRCARDWYGLPVEKGVVELIRRPQQVS